MRAWNCLRMLGLHLIPFAAKDHPKLSVLLLPCPPASCSCLAGPHASPFAMHYYYRF